MTTRKLTPAEALECLRDRRAVDRVELSSTMFYDRWGTFDHAVWSAIAALEEAMAQKPPAVVDMNVCEIDHLFLNTGVLYRFRRAEGCDACASYGKRSDKPAAPVPSDEEIVAGFNMVDLPSNTPWAAIGRLTNVVSLLARRIGVQGVPQ